MGILQYFSNTIAKYFVLSDRIWKEHLIDKLFAIRLNNTDGYGYINYKRYVGEVTKLELYIYEWCVYR